MMEAVRVVLVGCGGMGTRHLLAYAQMAQRGMREVRLVGVCDESPARAAEAAARFKEITGSEVAIHIRFDDVLADSGVEAVDIALPTWLHHEMVVAAIGAGKHVLVEKPLAITIKACDRIVAAAQGTSRIVGVAENFRRLPGNRAVKHLIDSGELGAPYYVLLQNISISGALSVAAPGGDNLSSWYEDRRRVGSREALELGVHEADLLRYWFGDVEEVSAMVGRFTPRPPGLPADVVVEDTMLATLRFKSGVMGQLAFSSAGFGPDRIARRICFDAGTLDSSSWFNWEDGALHRRDGPEVSASDYTDSYLRQLSSERHEELLPRHGYDPDNLAADNRVPLRFGVGLEIIDFARAIRAGRQPEVTVEDGRLAVALSYAILESAVARRSVKLSEVLEGTACAYQAVIDEATGLAIQGIN
jgi:predicted dehydrogenase